MGVGGWGRVEGWGWGGDGGRVGGRGEGWGWGWGGGGGLGGRGGYNGVSQGPEVVDYNTSSSCQLNYIYRDPNVEAVAGKLFWITHGSIFM